MSRTPTHIPIGKGKARPATPGSELDGLRDDNKLLRIEYIGLQTKQVELIAERDDLKRREPKFVDEIKKLREQVELFKELQEHLLRIMAVVNRHASVVKHLEKDAAWKPLVQKQMDFLLENGLKIADAYPDKVGE